MNITTITPVIAISALVIGTAAAQFASPPSDIPNTAPEPSWLEVDPAIDDLIANASRPKADVDKADPADTATALFGGHCDNGLGLDSPAVVALFRATDIGFVHLDSAREAIPIGPDHRSP